MPVGKGGRGSNGRRDVLGFRVNTVIFCVWSKHNKKIPTDSGVPQIRLPRLDYLLRGWEGRKKKTYKLVFAHCSALARCSVEDVFSSWRPTLPTSSWFWRVSDLQAGTLWICLFPSFPEAGWALSEANSLYLLFKFSGCFSWVLICCLRDYPHSEFVFQASSSDESCTASFYYMWEGMWLRSPVLVSLHLLHSWTDLFFVMQRRGVNNTCPVVGNNVSTALFWGRCVRCFTGAPPCGKPVPGSSLWRHMEQQDPGKFRHGAPCEWLGLGVEFLTPSTLSWQRLCLAVEVSWSRGWTHHPYLLVSSSPARILQRLFSLVRLWSSTEVKVCA